VFAWWGRTVYRFRYIVIGVMVSLCIGGGVYGMSLGEHVTQSGFYDEGSQSVHASLVSDKTYGRDTSGHIIAIYTAPDGKSVDDPAFMKKVLDNLAGVQKEHPDQILRYVGYFTNPDQLKTMADGDKKHAFVSVQLKGNDDDTILKNYNKNVGTDGTTVKDALAIPGTEVQLAGLQPLAAELTGTIGEDQKRAEVAAIPVVLFFVFGGVIAAALPGVIGGLTIAGALGIMRLIADFIPVHFFAQPVVTLMGLGIAVDYGLFMVSRFREELAEGYDTEAAVRRTVMTSGRTIMFSAVILVASSVPLLLFPQGFLKSITYAIIASVMLAAILSITVLAAALAILGPRVDALGVKTLIKFAEPDPIASDPENPRTNTFAIAAIPLGILLPPVGIALGHIARSRIRHTGEKGAGLATIGLLLGYTVMLGGFLYGTIALHDSGTIASGVYYLLLGIVIFLVIVIAGLALARAVPLARTPIVWWLHWLTAKTQKTKTRAEVEKGFWGKLVNKVMKRPAMYAIPIVVAMVVLIIPLGQLALGGISEKYLPPDNSVRTAQQDFDKTFPGFRTEPLTLVIESTNGQPVTDQQVAEVRNKAMQIPGFTEPDNNRANMWKERSVLDGATKDPNVKVIQNGLVTRGDAAKKINELRALTPPRGVTVSVGGTPALEQDSIHSLFSKLPLMVILLITTTTILMFLAFGSLVLPIKAALMSALTLGSTMGILTWMFVDGHGSGLMNYTPQPLMAPMIGLIIAVIWGLSTDYEVFLVSRMVEARERGMSTAEAIRIGTATTGRLITGAALVLAVVAGAFVFSDLVMMKYLAFGLLIALLLDATIVRMFLVPAIMKMLGDDCWWAPRWMKRVQERLGLGETELPDERKRPTVREPDEALVGAGASMAALTRPPHDPGHPEGPPRPGGGSRVPAPPPARVSPPSAAGTTRLPTPAGAPAGEAATTRFTAAKSANVAPVKAPPAKVPPAKVPPVAPPVVPPAVPHAKAAATGQRPARIAPPPRGQEPAGRGQQPRGRHGEPPRGQDPSREIESWLGELRNGGSSAPKGAPTGAAPQPSAEETRAIPAQRPVPPVQPGNEPTTALPAQRQEPDATEAIKTGDEPTRRGGGGVSAQDLLRREGRL
jgi:trehalose monomycolate/heme transporter